MKKLLFFLLLFPFIFSCNNNQELTPNLEVSVKNLLKSKEFQDFSQSNLQFALELMQKTEDDKGFKSKLGRAIQQNDDALLMRQLGFESNQDFKEQRDVLIGKLQNVYSVFPELKSSYNKDELLQQAFSKYTEKALASAKTSDARSSCMYKAAGKYGLKLIGGMIATAVPSVLGQIGGVISIGLAVWDLIDDLEKCNQL